MAKITKNTVAVLEAMGIEYVRIAKRELKVTRSVESKTTGKTYRKKVENSGKLGRSFKSEVNASGLEMDIKSASYANDVNDGTPRNASWANLINWIKTKPYTFKTTTFDTQGNIVARGTSRGTPREVSDFAKYLRDKIAKIGSDRTGYLDGIREKVTDDYTDDLNEAAAKDIADTIAADLNSLNNVSAISN